MRESEREKPQFLSTHGMVLMTNDAMECQDSQSARSTAVATGGSLWKGLTQPGNKLYKYIRECVCEGWSL